MTSVENLGRTGVAAQSGGENGDGERGFTDSAVKDKLGVSSHEKKVKLSLEDLWSEWASRLTPG